MVDDMGVYIIDTYYDVRKGEYDKAINELEKSSAGSAIQLLNEWESIKKKDRLYLLKRKLLLRLSENLHKQSKYKELAYWSKKWLAMDERDVTAMAFYYQALLHLDQTREEGVKGMINAYRKFPDNKYLKRFYNTYRKNNSEGL
ncbi:MAG TPA: hypothetical protein ENJ32_01510 [Crenotrichaceae bacterium]|nr:hypothetical protein [Crenotrichaceae bacterium]